MSPKQIFTLSDVRVMAIDPAMLGVASDYAKRFHPRTALARAA